MADSLATITSNFKIPIFSSRKFEIHLKNRPVIPDNLRYWQGFWNYKKVNNFQHMEGEFENSYIDEVYDKDDQVIKTIQVYLLQLKDNKIPRGLVPLEQLFNQYDVPRKPNMVPTEKGVKDVNFGTTENPNWLIFPSHYLQR